jgi:hypothetical protein
MDCTNCRKPLGVDKVEIDGVPGEYCPDCAAEYMATWHGTPQAAASIADALRRTGAAIAFLQMFDGRGNFIGLETNKDN